MTHDQVEAMTLADKIVVLKDGEVMQVGTPMSLFNLPENEFVAGFLGSPKMNFFNGKLSKSKNKLLANFKGNGFEAKNIRLVSKNKTDNDTVKLGIRPQHLYLDPKGGIIGTVTLIEHLGTETIIELITSDKTLFRFTSPELPKLKIGDTANFSFNNEAAHLF